MAAAIVGSALLLEGCTTTQNGPTTTYHLNPGETLAAFAIAAGVGYLLGSAQNDNSVQLNVDFYKARPDRRRGADYYELTPMHGYTNCPYVVNGYGQIAYYRGRPLHKIC